MKFEGYSGSEEPYLFKSVNEGSRETQTGSGKIYESPSWLSEYGFISPEKLERCKQHPASEGHTPERIIMDALLSRLIEEGPELNPTIRARLRNLVGILRIVFFPNMNQQEQESILNLVTRTTTVDFSSLQYEVTPETIEDVQWIWDTFGLSIPYASSARSLPSMISQILEEIRKTDKETSK